MKNYTLINGGDKLLFRFYYEESNILDKRKEKINDKKISRY